MEADDVREEIVVEEEERRLETRQMPSAGLMLGAGMAIIGLGVLGRMVYRRRQQSRDMVRRLARRIPLDRVRLERLPGAFDDVRDEVMTQLRRVRSR